LQEADELQGVDHGFAEVVVVGDDEAVGGFVGDGANAGGPRGEFFGGVEVVVTLVRGEGGVVGKPGVVTAALEGDVADGEVDSAEGSRERPMMG
jgi:hypothetical protein